MDKNIKISIIIPVYNTSKYLKKCITSISNQSLREIEIICVNDGSTDNSLEILEKMAQEDERIKIINKKNEGPSKARNVALKIAKGKYYLNIDSDDWIEQEYLKDIYDRAEKDNLDITICDAIFDFVKDKNRNYILKDLSVEDREILSGDEYITIFFKNNFYGYTWNKLIKREIYVLNNILYPENIFYREDVEVLLRLAYFSKKIGKLNRAYYHYIQWENNVVNKVNEKKFYDLVNSFSNLESFFINYSNNIYDKIKRRKIFDMLYLIFNEKLENLSGYNEIIKILSNEVKKNNFIFKRKEEDSLKMVILFDILKIFNKVSFIKLLIKLYKSI